MPLPIKTFSNKDGPDCLFKALGHPLVATLAAGLLEDLRAATQVAVYDPFDILDAFSAFNDLNEINFSDLYVQNINDVGCVRRGLTAQPLSLLSRSKAEVVLVLMFDADRLLAQIDGLLPASATCRTLKSLRLPDHLITLNQKYLSPINFATNFAFFRDVGDLHTTLTTVNYWHGYGARAVKLWLCLFDDAGVPVATWEEELPDQSAGIVIDSSDVRRRFNLGPFTGQLFIHAIGIAGHDQIKYVLDIFSDGYETLSCTHDANSWPAEVYAGLPAPMGGEEVTLWVQNSHPVAIPPRSIGLRVMGVDELHWIDEVVEPFATMPINVSQIMSRPVAGTQLELHAGKYLVRPRYEVVDSRESRRIAHVNVQRTDLIPDQNLPRLRGLVGKGYILAAPILPANQYDSKVFWTPMATTQNQLAAHLTVFDREGIEVKSFPLRFLGRGEAIPISVTECLRKVKGEFLEHCGHMELTYDLVNNPEADGWLHAIFCYRNTMSGHQAETSFGSHMFNIPVTYKDQPQSYTGKPPGLSTRLYVRVGHPRLDTILHLIYPASMPWLETSNTTLSLKNGLGQEVATHTLQIPCGGSRMISIREIFRAFLAGNKNFTGYVSVRDLGCRIFGYHALVHPEGAFSLDHMFGF
ncbi:MAG: hypothetical protein CMM32_12270 [Rhodospirillaceae bacterium]|nr:hypothetical protein [Rhodospirillaceae bacterium]